MNEVTTSLASRDKRLIGALIDGLIMMAIIIPIMYASGMLHRPIEERKMTMGQQAVMAVVGCVIFLILNGYLLFKRGQTIGKVAMKTKIIDLNGSIPNFGKLLVLRYLILGVVSNIPIIGGLIGLANALFIFGKDVDAFMIFWRVLGL